MTARGLLEASPGRHGTLQSAPTAASRGARQVTPRRALDTTSRRQFSVRGCGVSSVPHRPQRRGPAAPAQPRCRAPIRGAAARARAWGCTLPRTTLPRGTCERPRVAVLRSTERVSCIQVAKPHTPRPEGIYLHGSARQPPTQEGRGVTVLDVSCRPRDGSGRLRHAPLVSEQVWERGCPVLKEIGVVRRRLSIVPRPVAKPHPTPPHQSRQR